jgi:hypothetical protein
VKSDPGRALADGRLEETVCRIVKLGFFCTGGITE